MFAPAGAQHNESPEFARTRAAVSALGGSVSEEGLELLDKLQDRALEIVPPAKNSWAEIEQVHRDHDEVFVMLTKHQLGLVEKLHVASWLLFKAPAGSGKTLICAKLGRRPCEGTRADARGPASPPARAQQAAPRARAPAARAQRAWRPS